MKPLVSLLLVLFITSCAPILVNYDYESTTDFGHYKAYNMFPGMETGLSDLDTKRLLNAVDGVLQAQGFILSETPDFYVNIQSREFQSESRNTVGVGIGGSGRNVGGGINIGIPVGQSNVDRELIFDLVDVKKDDLFWQAISESSFNPNASPGQRQERLNAIVTKVFSEYPPQK